MKELIKKLTEHYAWCIENIPKEGFYNFCVENEVQYGVCWCSKRKFRYNIAGHKFTRDFTKGLAYLCETPDDTASFKESLESLRTRHKRLLEMADWE